MAIKIGGPKPAPALAPQARAAHAPAAGETKPAAWGSSTSSQALMANRTAQAGLLKLAAPVPWTYQEITQQPHNAALIETSAAAIRKAMLDKGIKPESAAITFAVDITGHQISVCSACGVVGHDFAPVLVRRLNPAINMLDEYVAVTLAIANKTGLNYSMVAYDEQVLPLRPLGPPGPGGDVELKRFQMFRERHPDLEKTIVDGQVQEWMREALAKWTPADNITPKVGQPADRQALSVAERLLSGHTGMRGIMLAKAQAPVSLRPFESLLQSKGIVVGGVAVGADAARTAPLMFKKTLVTTDMHGLRSQVAPAVVAMASEAAE